MIETANALRILIAAPVGRDAALICEHLQRAGVECAVFTDFDALCDAFGEGAGALLFTEEALTAEALRKLTRALEKQPAWSEVPILILTGLPSMEVKTRSYRELQRRTNITLLDRPVRIQSLISAAQSALNARKRQYEVRDLMNELEDRVHERDRFLAILGHELRNPLGAILLASQMTNGDGKLDADHVRLIERQSRHLTRIVNDLLDLSRVVSGKIVIRPQLIDLRRIAQQSLQTLEEASRAHRVSVEIRTPDERIPIHADPTRVDQILTNVLSNAIKYTPENGHVVVSLERDDSHAILSVQDDGVGIAAERIGTIFELFAQAENAIGRSQGGMGIGLALVRNLVELHGGSITAESDGLGKGSRFVIRFPLSDAAAVQEPPDVVDELRPMSPRRIVIVEDNNDVRELLRLKLRKLGHDVEAVADGISGVATILASKPHMALIDIGLPHLDGYQVATRVRAQLGRDVVLVAVSGFGLPEDKRKAAEAGFDDHLTKPADVQAIEGLLARFAF